MNPDCVNSRREDSGGKSHERHRAAKTWIRRFGPGAQFCLRRRSPGGRRSLADLRLQPLPRGRDLLQPGPHGQFSVGGSSLSFGDGLETLVKIEDSECRRDKQTKRVRWRGAQIQHELVKTRPVTFSRTTAAQSRDRC